jgi:hypothetical protein
MKGTPMSIRKRVTGARAVARRRGTIATMAALAGLFALFAANARADDFHSGGCVGSGFAFACASTSHWDEYGPRRPYAAENSKLSAEAADRERKWVARCKPQIVQDRYGVRRYHYAAPGCEFGKSED